MVILLAGVYQRWDGVTMRGAEKGAMSAHDGVAIDRLVLSAEKYRTVRPGVVKNDATILPATPRD